MTPQGPERQTLGAASRRQGGRHLEVQEAGSVPDLFLQRRRRQSVARGRLDQHAGAGRRAQDRHQVVHRRRRAGQGRQADLGHQRLRLERQLRFADRLAQHDRSADAGGRGSLQETARHRLRPRRADPVPRHLRQSDRRLRLGHPDGQLHRLQAAEGRQGAGAAHPAGRRRAGDALVGGATASSRSTASMSSAPNSPTATTPRPSRSSTTTSTASARSTRSGWTPARRRSRRSRRSRMPASPIRSSPAKTRRTS